MNSTAVMLSSMIYERIDYDVIFEFDCYLLRPYGEVLMPVNE